MPPLNLPKLAVPAWDHDIQTFPVWYASAWNNWVDGDPDSDPRRFEGFVIFARAAGKDTRDLSLLGAPAWLPAPLPPLAPLPPTTSDPDPAPPPQITTRFGLVTEPANSAIQKAWPRQLWVAAAEVSYKESGWNPRAENNTLHIGPCGTQYTIPGVGPATTERSLGLYQVNVCAWGGGDELFDPLVNAKKGYEIYQRQGWNAWFYSAKALGLI